MYGNSHSRRDSGSSSVLFSAYEHEEALGLTRLDEDSDEEQNPSTPMMRQGGTKGRSGGSKRLNGVNGSGAHSSQEVSPAQTSKQQKRHSLLDDSRDDIS